jgi:hypothetical protein
MGDLDIRGKVTDIDAKKKFHLIEDHRIRIVDDRPPVVPEPPVPSKTALLKLFFGLEVGCGRKRGGCAIGAAGGAYNYNNTEFMDFEEDEKMMDEDEETQDIDAWQQQIIRRSSSGRRSSQTSSHKIGAYKRHAKSRFEQPLAPMNPYLKKNYACEVELAESS